MYEVSSRFLEATTGSHRAVVRVQVLPTDSMPQFGPDPTGGIELPLLDGDIKLTSTQDVNGTCDFTISGDYWELLQPYGAELFVQRGIDFGDHTSELVPCGYYGIEEISQDRAPSGPVRVSGADRSQRLKRSRVLYPITFPVGTTHKIIFDCLVNGVIPPGDTIKNYGMYLDGDVPINFTAYDPNTAKLGASLTCEDDAHAFLAKIADARGCVLRFDRHGELTVQPRNIPPGAESIYSIRGGVGGNLVAAARKVTRDGVYNLVVARGSDPANPTGYRLAYNEDATSPLVWHGPFGVVPRYYASPLLITNDSADAAAETVLSRYKGLPSALSLLSVPNPALDPLDVVDARLGNTAATHLIDQVSIPLVGSQPVQIVTRTLNEILISDDDTGSGGTGFPNPPPQGGGGTPGGGGSGGGGGGGTDDGLPDKVVAAQLILDRLNSGLSIFEDWTWSGAHAFVGQHNDALIAEFKAANPGASTLGPEARTWLANYVATSGAGSGGGGTTTRTAGPGGIAAPAGATLTTANSSSQLNISSGGTASAPKVYDGQGHTVGRINVTADWVVVQNFHIDANNQYGAFIEADNVTFQNNDIKGVSASGDGDLNAITAFGDNIKILYNLMVNYVEGNPGGSHTDGIQTWVSSSHSSSSNNWEIVGNKFIGPDNPSRDNGVASIHQCIMVEGQGQGGNSGGSGGSQSNWLILENEFHASWNQDLKFDTGGGSGWKIARNVFSGSSDRVIDPGDTGITFYSDNMITGDYGATGISITSGGGPANPYATTGGGGGTGSNPGPQTMPTKVEAALLIYSRMSSNLAINEDWSWTGMPTLVGTYNDALLAEFQAANPSTSSLSATAQTWLLNYVNTNGASGGGAGGGTGGTATTMPTILRLGKASGLTKVNLGVDYLPGQGPSGKQGTHVDHTLAEIENNLSIPGYADIDTGVVRLTSYVGAATTPNSTHSRTEYRELATDGVAKASWSNTSGEHYVWCRGAVVKLAPGRPHVVIAQVHDADDDVATIRVEGTNVVSTYGDSGRPGTLATGLVLGSEHQWMIKTVRSGSNTIIQYFWDDMSTPKATQSYAGGSGNYFKFGNYHQSTTSDDDQGDTFVVDLYDSEVWHTGYPAPVPRSDTGGGSGVPPQTQAAQFILDRLNSGLAINEDWTWSGAPAIVGQYNDALLTEFNAANPSTSTLGATAKSWLSGYITSHGGTAPGGGGGGGSTGTRTVGPGGVPKPAGAVTGLGSSGSQLNISTGGTSSNPRVIDGESRTVGRINVTADWVVVQNYHIDSGNQYGVFIEADNVTLQNCDIKGLTPTGDGDLNGITAFGNNIKILFNNMVDFVDGDPGGSHTDGIQTWVSSSHPSSSNNWEIVGNIMTGPANPSRDNGIASIHQCIMVEGQGRGGNSGGSGGQQSGWLIADNTFGDSWNQCLKFDTSGSGWNVTRNKFVGSSDRVIDPGSTGIKFYSDNQITGDYGTVGISITSGSGPPATSV